METIAILIHSQQPLSYLERLIQTELSSIEDESGHKRPPGIFFIACQFEDDAISPRISHNGKSVHDIDLSHDMEVKKVEGEDDKGQGRRKKPHPPEEDIHTYTSLGKPQSSGNSEKLYVRWSHATEVGDFIRDAAQAGEFIIAIEGAPDGLDQIRIKVPSFNERTYYLRMRLRMISNRISKIASIKYECDKLAHRGGQRVALAGFGVLASWWLLVYKLTFLTSLGWDTMEPVTYLVSLSTLMGGYLWFLYHNREISYRSALEFTINNRQKKLYQEKGVDLQVWENLIHEGNLLRREIRAISSDYDTEWDEKMDEHDERVIEAMKQKRNEGKSKDKDDCLDDDKDKSND
ncbi:related to COQ2 -para-hydroxybenzoate--polyprenyltransferase [Cephalotrichum gorgonifer]|uniref:Calcium uniporter protein n=1 Tax=Cephalotrichum gorgonifer TaxID=2041049 RepID=A0AAE8N8U3_9PEZI|nr:related to COQ2 -para-hydroxybenzoate--polyprenyltransferase [Cephalotrichum gorgonifer]